MAIILGLCLGLCVVLAGNGSAEAWFCCGILTGTAVGAQWAISKYERDLKWRGKY